MLETPADILAKKVVYRGSRLQARDMFDIAATVQALGRDDIVPALKPFAAECKTALNVAKHSDPMFIEHASPYLRMQDKARRDKSNAESQPRDFSNSGSGLFDGNQNKTK